MSSGKFRSKAPDKVKPKGGDHNPSECNHKIHGKFIHHKPQRAIEGKEIIEVCESNTTRYLIVPSRKPTDPPGILSKSEMDRLQKQAQVVSMKDRMTLIEDANKKKIEAAEESEERKQMLKKSFVPQRSTGSKLNQIEDEAKDRSQYLLKRAQDLRQEQEDEVRKANAIILATKCKAIRSAQIHEKELIDKQLEEEERRLDMMMEQTRQKAIKNEERKKELEEEKNSRYVKEIKEQIQERELERLLEAERKEEESKMINRALIAMQKEEEEKRKKKHEDNLKTREELQNANMELEKYKLLQKEEERIADMRVQEFMRKKAEREQGREEEQAAIKAAKEREVARLRSLQEKAQDQQALLDEMNAQRIQEEVEREWRNKQLAIAKKKKDDIEQLHITRAKQIEDIRKAQAIELARDEQLFYQVAKVQAKQYETEMEKRQRKKEAAVCLREELLKQINEKEKDRIHGVQEKFEEGNALRLEKELRDLRVKQYIQQKVHKLSENNVPDVLIKDIERQIKSQK